MKDLIETLEEYANGFTNVIAPSEEDVKELLKHIYNQEQEIERLNNIINEFEDILKTDIKACNNKFENMFDRNYRRLILEEKLEQLQELKGSDKE